MENVKFTDYLARIGWLPADVVNISNSLPLEFVQIYCTYFMANRTKELEAVNASFCPSVYDGHYCWAPVLGGSRPARRCPEETLDSSQFAYRYCQKDGAWENKTNYDLCYPVDAYEVAIFFTGYGLSLVCLSVSLGIFLYFKILRCLRNHIHVNLIISFLIRSLAYFATYFYAMLMISDPVHFICNVMHSIPNFAMISNHIWMMLEGLYLFLIILCTFRVEKLKFWHFALIGWGSSALLTGTYCVVMAIYHPDKCWNEVQLFGTAWIIDGSIIASLVVNTLFLMFILYSLVIKVKATQRYRPSASLAAASEATVAIEYRKMLKALLILFPLLGIGYIFFIIPPHHSPAVMRIHRYISAIIISTQGFCVALIYCFLNSEVRSAVRTQCAHWEQTRSFMRQRPCSTYSVGGPSRRHSRTANLFLSADQRGANGPDNLHHSFAEGINDANNDAHLRIPLARRHRPRRGTGGERELAETALHSPQANGRNGAE